MMHNILFLFGFHFRFIAFVFLVFAAYSCDINEEWDDCLEECNGPGMIETEYQEVEIGPFVMEDNIQVTTFTDSICGCDFGLNINFEYLERITQSPARECCGYDYELVQSVVNIDLLVINTEDREQTDIADNFRLTFPKDDGTTLKAMVESEDHLDYGYFTMELLDEELIPASAKFKVKIELANGETLSQTSEEILFSQE